MDIVITNNGSFPVFILGGRLDVYINGVLFCRMRVKHLTIGGHGAVRYTTPVEIPSPLCLNITDNITIDIRGWLYMLLPVYVSISRNKSPSEFAGILDIIDVVGLPKRRLMVSLSAQSSIIIKNVFMNATLGIYGDNSYPGVLVMINDTWVSQSKKTVNATVYIPSNTSIGGLINNTLWRDLPARITGVILLHRDSWLLRVNIDTMMMADVPFPHMCIGEVSPVFSGNRSIKVELIINNEYSIEARILNITIHIYIGNDLIAVGYGGNRTIYPRTLSRIAINTIVVGGLESLPEEEVITIRGSMLLRIVDTTYIVPIFVQRSII